MSILIRVSNAASIALHTMVYLADLGERTPVSTREISETLFISEAHLSKVVQRLSRAGLVRTLRGPYGGVRLAKPTDEINLLQIFEAIEGPVETQCCLNSQGGCHYGMCVFGEMFQKANFFLKDSLERTVLSTMTDLKAGDGRSAPPPLGPVHGAAREEP